MDWQPIENAPKDGTEIMLCRYTDRNLYFVSIGTFGTARMQDDGYIANAGKPTWLQYNKIHIAPTPTHWMPLPPPPKQGGNRCKDEFIR